MKLSSLGLGLGMTLSLAAMAQHEMPAIGTDVPVRAARDPAPGTTIIGQRESPIGLYITPWRDAKAEAGIDRPARLLQEQIGLLDKAVFLRQTEYYNALSSTLKSKGAVTPQ